MLSHFEGLLQMFLAFLRLHSVLILHCWEERGLTAAGDNTQTPNHPRWTPNPEAWERHRQHERWWLLEMAVLKWKSGVLFKSVLYLLIPLVMYGLGSEMRRSLQQFPGNYRALTSKAAEVLRADAAVLTIFTVWVSMLVTALCDSMGYSFSLYWVCHWEPRGKGIGYISACMIYICTCMQYRCMHICILSYELVS